MTRPRQQSKPKRGWTLPSEDICRQGSDEQSADLRKRVTAYARSHPDRFPRPKAVRAAHEYYKELMRDYLAKAQAAGKCPTARDIADLPVIRVFSGAIGYPDIDSAAKYYAATPPDLRMASPVEGMDELVIHVSYKDEEEAKTMAHVQILDPGTRDGTGTLTRRIAVTKFYKTPDTGLHPYSMSQVNLYIGRTSDPKSPNTVTGKPEHPDLIGVDRECSSGMVEYLTMLSPAELGWDEDRIDFWEAVALPHAGHGHYLCVTERSDIADATVYTSVVNTLAYALKKGELEPVEPSKRAAERQAARPKYLRPDPFADTRKTWKVGPLYYTAREAPVLTDPDRWPDPAFMEENADETEEAKEGSGSAPGGMDDAGTGDAS